jgi:hypothetical protein
VIIVEDFKNTCMMVKTATFQLSAKIVTTGYLQYPNENIK